MNCADVNTILDEHRHTRLTAAVRSVVDTHLLGCADCAAGWLAHTELLRDHGARDVARAAGLRARSRPLAQRGQRTAPAAA